MCTFHTRAAGGAVTAGEEAEEEEVNTKGGDCDYVEGACAKVFIHLPCLPGWPSGYNHSYSKHPCNLYSAR